HQQAALRGRAVHPRPAAQGDPARQPAAADPTGRRLPAPQLPGSEDPAAARLHGRALPEIDQGHPEGKINMLKLVAKSLALGFVGLVVAPVVVFFGVLAVGYTFDTRCGTPGDSGGCEMGAATMAIAAAPV